MRRLTVVLSFSIVCLGTQSARGAAPFTAETLRPYLNNQVNALELNHAFLQSMFALDATPFTVGFGARAAPASYLRTDGEITDAGLGMVNYVLSLGAGRPSSSVAVFGGLNVSNVRPSGFPNILELAGSSNDDKITGGATSAVVFLGAAYKGWALEGALFRTELGFDADSAGRFQPGGCDKVDGCVSRETRPGAPVEDGPTSTFFADNNWLVNLEHESSSYIGLLFSTVRNRNEDGTFRTTRKLTAVRTLFRPEEWIPEEYDYIRTGLNSYAPEVDFYGDSIDELNDAIKEGREPVVDRSRMFEWPIDAWIEYGEHVLNTRTMVQLAPSVLFRSFEMSYLLPQDRGAKFLPQAGAQLKVFRRGDRYVPAANAFAGLFWIYEGDALYGDEEEPDGVALYASYSYNSPDNLTFVPLIDSHVLGLQIVWGNPMALPPPVPILEYPSFHAEAE